MANSTASLRADAVHRQCDATWRRLANPFSHLLSSITQTSPPFSSMLAREASALTPTTTRQERARSQQRCQGRFVSNLSRPGVSDSTRLRNARRKRKETPEQRRKNVSDLVNALLCPGQDKDYVPATANLGPLIEIVELIIKPEYSIATRLIHGVAKDVYLMLSKKRTLPRINIKRNGVTVKMRAYVFRAVRLPDPAAPGTLVSLKRLVVKWSREGKSRQQNVEATLNQIMPFLQSYNSDTFEYTGYPPPSDSGNLIARSSAPSAAATVPTDEQIYVHRIDVMAGIDSEYVLLKTVLAEANPILFRSAVQKWQRVLSSLSEAGNLTSLEQAIIEYAQIDDMETRLRIEQGLKKLLLCLMQIRQIDGKDLMLHQGYNPPEFCSDQNGSATAAGFAVEE